MRDKRIMYSDYTVLFIISRQKGDSTGCSHVTSTSFLPSINQRKKTLLPTGFAPKQSLNAIQMIHTSNSVLVIHLIDALAVACYKLFPNFIKQGRILSRTILIKRKHNHVRITRKVAYNKSGLHDVRGHFKLC